MLAALQSVGTVPVSNDFRVFSRRRNVFSDRLLSCSGDGRLFHTGSLEKKDNTRVNTGVDTGVNPFFQVNHCGLVEGEARWPIDVCTLGRSTHPVDADRSRGHP